MMGNLEKNLLVEVEKNNSDKNIIKKEKNKISYIFALANDDRYELFRPSDYKHFETSLVDEGIYSKMNNLIDLISSYRNSPDAVFVSFDAKKPSLSNLALELDLVELFDGHGVQQNKYSSGAVSVSKKGLNILDTLKGFETP